MKDEKEYLKTFLAPIKKCKNYKPKFGNAKIEKGFSLEEFHTLYGSDPFYNWIGLDSDLMYAAHKAAGGMTSIYRQIGIGCERLFREIVIDTTEYADPKYAEWSYTAKTGAGKEKTLSLDARLEFSKIKNRNVQSRVRTWLDSYRKALGGVESPKHGVVFEVRQGYKSKDSKRQNADIDNASVAWAHGYLPVFAIFSAQIDGDIVLRYKNNRCGVLIGSTDTDDAISLFAFSKKVLGYDLARFFKENSGPIRKDILDVLQTLLSAK